MKGVVLGYRRKGPTCLAGGSRASSAALQSPHRSASRRGMRFYMGKRNRTTKSRVTRRVELLDGGSMLRRDDYAGAVYRITADRCAHELRRVFETGKPRLTESAATPVHASRKSWIAPRRRGESEPWSQTWADFHRANVRTAIRRASVSGKKSRDAPFREKQARSCPQRPGKYPLLFVTAAAMDMAELAWLETSARPRRHAQYGR